MVVVIKTIISSFYVAAIGNYLTKKKILYTIIKTWIIVELYKYRWTFPLYVKSSITYLNDHSSYTLDESPT